MNAATDFAPIATRAQVLRAIASDAVFWIAPVALALSLNFIPAVTASLLLSIAIWSLAALVSVSAFAVSASNLGRYGYTEGLRKRGLRVIDPRHDSTLYKARLYRKSIWALFAGRYEVISIGVTA